MGSMLYAGIDPGLSGAWALLDPFDGFGRPMARPDLLTCEAFPTFTHKTGRGKTRTELDLNTLFRAMNTNGYGDQVICTLEQVSAAPGQGVSGMFRFGQAFGQVHALAAAAGWGIQFVTPVEWKRVLRLPGDKDASRKRAMEIWPEHAAKFALAKDHGKAEAALIAYWGWRNGALVRAMNANTRKAT